MKRVLNIDLGWFIMLGFIIAILLRVVSLNSDIKQIKHMVNEVICVALEMEE